MINANASTMRRSDLQTLADIGDTTWLGFLVFMSQDRCGTTTPATAQRIYVERRLDCAGFTVAANDAPRQGERRNATPDIAPDFDSFCEVRP